MKILRYLLLISCLLSFVQISTTGNPKPGDVNRSGREVAITFDDLPATTGDINKMAEVTEKLLASLKTHKVPAIGFVNEAKLYRKGTEDPRAVALLRDWLNAGMELGNHTYSHISIDQASLDEYQQDVIRGETITRRLLTVSGKPLRYFRHTQLHTGPTENYRQALNRFLAGRGYTVAPVTLDNMDFMFASVYSDARARGDQAAMKRVGEAYVPYMESIFAFFENLSLESFGYEVKQTLLLHANELNADYFNDLAAMIKRRGYRFISLDQALKDKAYALPEAQSLKGLSWIHRWRLAKGLSMKPEPTEPQFITEMFQARRR